MTTPRRQAHPVVEVLEDRLTPAAPDAPVIIEPEVQGQVVSNFDVHMEVNPAAFFDPDGDGHQATSWQIRESAANGSAVVWQALTVSDPLSKLHIHLGDGDFVGSLAGETELLPSRDYVLQATFTDSNNEVSATSSRTFRTADASDPVPGAGLWIVREGYVVELAVGAAFRLPVNIAFVPNAGPDPDDPFYYVAELYGSIKVVTRDGSVSDYATGLLDYNPTGPISGSGEQGLTGLAVDPVSGDLFVGMLWDNGTSEAERGGETLHFPKVERLHSTDGGRTLASRSIVLNMQPVTQGQSHQISNVSFGPDGKLYVHMGDGFNAAAALNLDSFLGKVLRLNPDGSPPTDNPFYSAADGITARDYIFTYGHRNPFGGAWRAVNDVHYVVENGNAIDRLVNLASGQSYGWNGDDGAIVANALYNWNPATAPVNIAFVQPTTFGGSLFPNASQDTAFVSLSGPTYGGGPQQLGKRIEQFTDLDTVDQNGKLTTGPSTLVRYNGTGRASVSALAAGPDGLYFADLYPDNENVGPTGIGANVYRVRYVDFAPTGLTPTEGDAQVGLSWTANDLADSYNVYRFIGHDDPPELIGNTTNTTFTDTTVTNGTTYHYFVRSVNAGGESLDSNTIHATPTAPGETPTVATAASATPNPVSASTSALSVLGADDQGEANLTYTWAAQGAAPAPVTFSVNGTNASKNTTATFSKAGLYHLVVTIRDQGGRTVQSVVNVTVNQTLTSVTVSPSSVSVPSNGLQQFTALARDQFGDPLANQPGFTWSVTAGVGTVDAAGLYRAASGGDSATVRVTTGGFNGTALVTLTAPLEGTGNGLSVVYYNRKDLSGTSIVRTDTAIDFNFKRGSPQKFIAPDTFSARWLGAIEPRFSELYTFTTTSNDGVRLWVDDQLLIDQWNDHVATEHTATITLQAGQRYALRLEYYENTGKALIKLEWASASQPREVVPRSQLYSGAPIRINFQPGGVSTPSGYLSDTGAAFASRGNGFNYGWNGTNSTGRDRNNAVSADQRYDTFLQLQKPALPNAQWEIAVPNGTYRVHLVAGDANTTNSVFRLDVEGVPVVNGTPTTSQRWVEGWRDVVVTDGRLTVSNGTGATNNKINFLDILPLGLDYSTGFSDAAGLTLNGSTTLVDGVIRLTDGTSTQAGSAFSTGRVNVDRFSTQFDFRLTDPEGDGFAFVVQGVAATALGPSGGGLGYGPDFTGGPGGIGNSIAVKFDLFSNQGEGDNSTGLFLNGAAPTIDGVTPLSGSTDLNGTGIDLHGGRTIRAHVRYDGSRLRVTLTDLETLATAEQLYEVDLIGAIGSSTAFVGFTAGTGGSTVIADVLNWRFLPG